MTPPMRLWGKFWRGRFFAGPPMTLDLGVTPMMDAKAVGPNFQEGFCGPCALDTGN